MVNVTKKIIPKEHYEEGRGRFRPEIVVLHIGEGLQNQIFLEFLNTEKSSHYCVSIEGLTWQYVEEKDTAFTQGIVDRPTSKIVLEHKGVNPNLFAISIEHEGYATEDITPAQYQVTSDLVREICERWLIPIDREHIIRHREIRASKTCPGKLDVDKIVLMSQMKKKLSILQQILQLVVRIFNLSK